MNPLSEGERERIIRVVDEAKGKEYWIILKSVIMQWIKEEHIHLDRFKARGLGADDMAAYNRGVDRIVYLHKFLNINESIIEYNISILEKAKLSAKKVYRQVESFVKETF